MEIYNKNCRFKTKKLRTVLLLVLMVAVISCFTGCGGGSKYSEFKIDAEAMAKTIIDEVIFDTQLQQVKKESVSTFIPMPEAEQAYMFMGSGEKADSFGVFVFKDEDDAEDGEKAIEEYIKELGDSFSRYIPEEADKAENQSQIIRKGPNVVFIICEDVSEATEVIERVFDEQAENPPENTEASEPEDESSEEPADNEENQTEEDTDEPEETGEDESEVAETAAENEDGSYPVIETDKKLTYSGYVALVGSSAYELYSYVDGVADSYAELVNYTADQLEGVSKVYDLVIPLSSEITLPDKYKDDIQSSDQKKALDLIYEKMDDNVIPVNIYDNLMKHRDEYVYFRTDHHWTSLGAYYGYEAWCGVKGLLPYSLDSRTKEDYGSFVGSFYYDTDEEILKNNPDNVEAYMPVSDVYIIGKKDSDGNITKKDVINDMTDAADFSKYDAFIGGDKPLVTIVNESINDDSSCMVIKESFGNCFVPYLADHYHRVYVFDYRYTSKNLVEVAKDKGIDDVIFVNNIGMTRSSYLVGKLSAVIK